MEPFAIIQSKIDYLCRNQNLFGISNIKVYYIFKRNNIRIHNRSTTI